MQHGNSLFFSQKGFPPCCQMTLPLRARATVTSTRFLHAGAMENILEQSWIVYQRLGCIWAVLLDSSQAYGIDSMGLRNYFFFLNQSSMQAIYSEGKGRIPVSVACFNFSIAEVWTANTGLTTACLANNGTCRRCEKHAADYYCSFKMLPTVRITRGGL